MLLHAALGIALVAAGAYAGYREYWLVGVLLLFAGMLVMDFFRQRVLAIARSRGPDNQKANSSGRQDGP